MGRPRKEISDEKIINFQRELELAGDRTDVLLQDKKGRSKSCLLCRRRKQRCDHKLPSCTACLKAGVKCVQPARYSTASNNITQKLSTTLKIPTNTTAPITANAITTTKTTTTTTTSHVSKPNKKIALSLTSNKSKDEYTILLEKKLKYLEKLIDLNPETQTFRKKLSQYKKITHLLGDLNPIDLESILLYRNHTSPPSPQQQQQQNSKILPPINSYSPISVLSKDSLDSIDFSKCIFSKYNLNEFLNYDPAFEFDENLSRSFLDTFFTRLQFKYPLLDENEIYTFHENYINNNIYAYSEIDFHFSCGRMWLVYSIAACLHMTTGKYKGQPPVRYFSTAIRHITRCTSHLNYVQQVELLCLLVLYLLRTDRDSMMLYDIIKDVVSIAKNNLQLNKWRNDNPFANKKLRLFWCVYLLERMICVAVGKKYTISESEIDLPYFNENSFNTKNSKINRGIHFINQSLKLRRIESQFVESLNILPQKYNNSLIDKSKLISQLPLVKKFFHDLEVWRSNCNLTFVKNFENETLKLYYYRSVRLLIQPFLEVLPPDDRLFRECQAAAGQTCQLYKIFHQRTITGHSTPAVHTVFVAGVTLIYCMWLARNFDDEKRKKLGDVSKNTRPIVTASLFSTMDDLRACSVCLYVMTERSNFARIFRDTFDQLMNATIGNLIERCGPNSSELIYMKKKKNGLMSKDDIDDNSSVCTNKDTSSMYSNNSNGDGMPPAVKRTFGKKQAQEHAGFVENSQVDLADQEEFRKRRGVLEKSTVPKSLSHLLTNDDDTDSRIYSNYYDNNNISNNTNVSNDDESKSSDDSKNENVYIVKKPINLNDFDWKTFEHQAFLQQHFAQQNLQAYLTSLNLAEQNKNSNNSSNIVKNELPINLMNLQFPPGVDPIPFTLRQVPVQQNMTPTPPISLNETVSLSSETRHRSTNASGILFYNGTHDMINNISTWTNDAVKDEISENGNEQGNSGGHGSTISSKMHNTTTPTITTSNYNNITNNNTNSATDNNLSASLSVNLLHVKNKPDEEFWTVNDDYGFFT